MIVYVVTNITNGKKYVGQTIRGLTRRRQVHEWHATQPDSTGHCAFQAAIAKYGREAFHWEVVFESDDHDQINAKEIELISVLNTLGKGGYNETAGGFGGRNKGGPVDVDCFVCNTAFEMDRNHYNQNIKLNRKLTCSKECRAVLTKQAHLPTEMTTVKCGNCDAMFDVTARHYRARLKIGCGFNCPKHKGMKGSK